MFHDCRFGSLVITALVIVMATVVLPGRGAQAETAPVRDLNTPRVFPEVSSEAEWKALAKDIREQVRVSCGLFPLPEKTPLQARIFDRVEREGYSIEKVAFQSAPGFYVCGNLYRPLGKGRGPFPAVLNPHGHWKEGRLADAKEGSNAARCINFARQGMIAFAYDMVGYNDTFFPEHGVGSADGVYWRHRRFATNEVNLLWNISLMGLQTWNSIRALDFLESLPDVDKTRLACTGESGGGTQTFMLGAIDDRLAAQAPVVMVSHSMQGGCLCENAPGLRIEHSNMEISAAAAPRPQILVGASGDWTKDTLTIEGPAISKVYGLLGAEDRLRYVLYDFGHNYNQTSREAVYGWFNKWLLDAPAADPIAELPYQKETDKDLLVWPDGKLPADAVSEKQLIHYLIGVAEAQFEFLLPVNQATLRKYKEIVTPLWRHTLQIQKQAALDGWVAVSGEETRFKLYRGASRASALPALQISVDRPAQSTRRVAVLAAENFEQAKTLDPFASALAARGWQVIRVEAYSTTAPANQFKNFYHVYNRTKAQECVRDLVDACAFARSKLNAQTVVLMGQGNAGLWALLAAPAADAVIADGNQTSTSDDSSLLAVDVFVPGLRRLGAFEGAALLAAPNPVLLHNLGTRFQTDKLRGAYERLGAVKGLLVSATRSEHDALMSWITELK